MSFGQRLRDLRKARGLTQVSLAEASGISAGQIAHLEQGTRDNPSLSTVQALAKALGVQNVVLAGGNAEAEVTDTADVPGLNLGAMIRRATANPAVDEDDALAALMLVSLWGFRRSKVPDDVIPSLLNQIKGLRVQIEQGVKNRQLMHQLEAGSKREMLAVLNERRRSHGLSPLAPAYAENRTRAQLLAEAIDSDEAFEIEAARESRDDEYDEEEYDRHLKAKAAEKEAAEREAAAKAGAKS